MVPATENGRPREFAVPRSPRYDTLDLWRGVACLAVVIFHSALYGLLDYDGVSPRSAATGSSALLVNLILHGREGVTLFFVISGYCIATTVDKSRRRSQPVTSYFKRRFRRIYPPYWTAIILAAFAVGVATAFGREFLFSHSLIAGNSIPNPSQLSLGQWLGNVTLIETWRRHVGGTELFFLGHAWTLCYEEQFYAVFGLILFLCPRRMFLGTVIVSVLTGLVYLLPPTWTQHVTGTFLDGRWLLFATGIGAYYAINYATTGAKIGLILGLVGAATVAKALPAPALATEFFVGSTFGALLIVLHPWDVSIARLKFLRPLKFCGSICYSLYLVHWPVAKLTGHVLYLAGVTSPWHTLFISVPVGVAASLSVAVPFYKIVERRFLNSPSQIQSVAHGGIASAPRVAMVTTEVSTPQSR